MEDDLLNIIQKELNISTYSVYKLLDELEEEEKYSGGVDQDEEIDT